MIAQKPGAPVAIIILTTMIPPAVTAATVLEATVLTVWAQAVILMLTLATVALIITEIHLMDQAVTAQAMAAAQAPPMAPVQIMEAATMAHLITATPTATVMVHPAITDLQATAITTITTQIAMTAAVGIVPATR